MKYYTKQWLESYSFCAPLCAMKPIADKEYTAKEIDELYNKKLKEEKNFKAIYASQLNFAHLYFPKWVLDCVNIRLIAMGYLPKSVYDRLIAEEQEKKAEHDKIVRLAEQALSAERKKIPQDIIANFGFHDGSVMSLEAIDGNVVMIIAESRPSFGCMTCYVKVTFENGKVIERDDSLKFDCRIVYEDGREYYDASCTWLYDELYKVDNGYEAHMLLTGGDSGYLTISCSNIKIEKHIESITQYVRPDRTLCEKIQTSCGLRQIINGNLHDAGIANAQLVGCNFVLTLDLDEGQTVDNVFYRKVMEITFESVSNCSVSGNETALIGLYVQRHREEMFDGKIRFLFELWKDSDNTLVAFYLSCDEVTAECILVKD